MANERKYPPASDPQEEIKQCLLLLLDNCDYTKHACRLMDAVGACIPWEVLERCNKAVGRK